MSMSDKDYAAIAAAIKEAMDYVTSVEHLKVLPVGLEPLVRQLNNRVVCLVALKVANALADDNPQFDANKFIQDCGWKE